MLCYFLSPISCRLGCHMQVQLLQFAQDVLLPAKNEVIKTQCAVVARQSEGRGSQSLVQHFFCIFDISRQNNVQALWIAIQQLQSLPEPMSQASTCDRVQTQGPSPSAPKQWEWDVDSDVHIKIKTLSARDLHTRNSRNKKLQRAQQCKRARPLTGSVPRKMAEELQRVSASCFI